MINCTLIVNSISLINHKSPYERCFFSFHKKFIVLAMNKIYGTYARNTLQEVWHSRKDCTSYPNSEHVEYMISTSPVPLKDICSECLELDTLTAKEISLEMSKDKATDTKLFF